MKKSMMILTLMVGSILVPVGCHEATHDPRLVQITDIVSENPHKALAYLDSIDYSRLSERDRHYYDFLFIKGKDKAFIDHKSDSLILDVIRYASSHRNEGWYTEALYYGGRVYSDIGDYPTALHYFHNALNLIEEQSDSQSLELKANLLSQTGDVLIDLRLYSDAIPYIKQSIQISKELRDTFGVVYDDAVLSHIYLNIQDFDSAKQSNIESLRYALGMSEIDRADIEIDRAAILYKEGHIDSALNVIRPLPMSVDSLCVNYALAVASEIYHDAGILDTAYIYAKKLALSKMQDNKRIGFRIMFSPELRGIVPKDSLLAYIPLYRDMLEKRFDQHDAQQAMIQNANYNYQMHLRERNEAESKTKNVMTILAVTLFVVLMLMVVVLMMRVRNLRQQVQLRKSLEMLEKLKADKIEEILSWDENENLKLKILEKLNELDNSNVPTVSEKIMDSKTYALLRQFVSDGRILNETLMNETERLVCEDSPQFKTRLQILANGKLRKSDIEIAILIRCGISPSEMAGLLNIAKNSVSSRRSSLAKKILGTDSNSRTLDKIIRSI